MSSTPQSSPDNPLYRSFLEGAKGRRPIDKWHHYFDIYHRYFAPYRGQSPTVLEIGVQNGGSLALWKDYFGPGARLFGADVDPACAQRAPEGTTVFIGDQADRSFLERVLQETGPPDIVIDDGGHTSNQMIVSFETLFPSMRSPGVYLVEDTHTQFWGGEWVDDPKGRNFIDYAARAAVALNEWTRRRENFARLRSPPENRPEPLPASPFCRMATSVCFHDSIIVFTRQDRPEPWADLRVQDPDLPPAPW